jgi:hypothetical protein
MTRIGLACAVLFSFGCGQEGFKPSGPDARVCEHVLCDGTREPPAGLLDADADTDADADIGVDEGTLDGGQAPQDDAGIADGGQEPETDASTPDSAIPDVLAPETLVGRWVVSTAVLKMCSPSLEDHGLVDGPGAYEIDEPMEVDAELNVFWLKGGPDCVTPSCRFANDLVYLFESFDGTTLSAASEVSSLFTRTALEVVFSDANTFEGVLVTEGTNGFCPCGGDDCGEPLRAVRGMREVLP